MSVIFGSARIGENSSVSGNKAGDASGNEVSTQAYYTHSKGWYGFAPKSDSVAQKLAQAMQDACDNNHIGYDQSDRSTLLTQYKKYGSIKAIATNCECDCSSLVRVCIYQATGTLLSDFTTSDEATVLANSGFFQTKKSVSSSSACCLGMVLVTKTKGHTGIICSGASLPSGGSASTSSGTSSSSKLPTYTTGKTYTLQVDRLAVRSGAGTSYTRKTKSKLTSDGQKHAYSDGYLKKGTKVTCKATKTVSGNVWMQIPSGWVAAYYDGKYYIK